MKFFILALLSLSVNAQAAAPIKQALDFKCSSAHLRGKQIVTVQLTQLNRGPIDENVKVPFQLEVKKTGVKPVVYKGFIETEDVHVLFESLDKKVTLTIYLDELYETTLRVQGQKDVQLDCEEHRW